ncbi:MAG TPA: carboxypeptidase regulatory-like domain-containing protein, partial [Myxococcaceae bacterium]|nr:carboxypeptidase regulatory-like domain-containing protein [Myxococcaceae bacterium]
MKRVLVFALVGPLAACGNGKSPTNDGITGGTQSPNNITLVAPSHPRGSISGQIVNSALGPISGATILLNLAEPAADVGATAWSTTSDASGNFSVNFVPAGAVILVTASATGYATVRKQVTIPASAGTFPIDNGNAVVGPLLLTKLDGALKVLLLDHNGTPAAAAQVTLEAQPAGTDLSGG